MAVSTIPAVKAALVSTISAAIADPDVEVTWSTPRGDKSRDWVRVGDVVGQQNAAALGRKRRQEDYRIEVLVSVIRSDVESPQSVAERACAIAGEIEDALRADERLGLGIEDGLFWAQVEKTDLAEGVAGGERWAEVTVHVVCMARI